MEPKNTKDNAQELLKALREDTKKISELSGDQLYSVQLGCGTEIISKDQKFENLGLKSELVNELYSRGFESPSHIQCSAVPCILSGKDGVFHSKSGSGKTIAFALGAANKAEQGKGAR